MAVVLPYIQVDQRGVWSRCTHGCGRFVTRLLSMHVKVPGYPLDYEICPECQAKGMANRVFKGEVLLCRNG